uniref:Uncharacterized protein n=1 Tax=Mycena chlorophos TaxID=658473 RepID=A0ABQ0LKB7_MYCCL|nr:predicted protein [Mycena chlorophos]
MDPLRGHDASRRHSRRDPESPTRNPLPEPPQLSSFLPPIGTASVDQTDGSLWLNSRVDAIQTTEHAPVHASGGNNRNITAQIRASTSMTVQPGESFRQPHILAREREPPSRSPQQEDIPQDGRRTIPPQATLAAEELEDPEAEYYAQLEADDSFRLSPSNMHGPGAYWRTPTPEGVRIGGPGSAPGHGSPPGVVLLQPQLREDPLLSERVPTPYPMHRSTHGGRDRTSARRSESPDSEVAIDLVVPWPPNDVQHPRFSLPNSSFAPQPRPGPDISTRTGPESVSSSPSPPPVVPPRNNANPPAPSHASAYAYASASASTCTCAWCSLCVDGRQFFHNQLAASNALTAILQYQDAVIRNLMMQVQAQATPWWPNYPRPGGVGHWQPPRPMIWHNGPWLRPGWYTTEQLNRIAGSIAPAVSFGAI